MQLRAFTAWLNVQLRAIGNKSINNIEKDLCDGVILLQLLQAIGSQKISFNTSPTTLAQKVENCCLLFAMLSKEGATIRDFYAEDLADGNPDVIIELLWQMIFMKVSGKLTIKEPEARQKLLAWCQSALSDSDVKVDNFDHSFKDGVAFAAILHKYKPSSIDIEVIKKIKEESVPLVLRAMEKEFGLSSPFFKDEGFKNDFPPDEKSVFAIVSIYHTLFNSS